MNLNKIIDTNSDKQNDNKFNHILLDTMKFEYGIAKCICIIGYENHEIIKYPQNQYQGYTKYINDESITEDERKIKIYKSPLLENAKPLYSGVILEEPLIAERDPLDLSYPISRKTRGNRF